MDSAASKAKDSKFAPAVPPPTFPPLYTKPCQLKSGPSMDYMNIWNEDFTMYLQQSPYYISKREALSDAEKPEFNYKLFPAILQPASFKRAPKTQSEGVKKKVKVVDVNDRLKVLEEKERNGAPGVKAEVESDGEAPQEEEYEGEDMEMDDENDYGQSYFNNGEEDDDDDGGDDGPVY